MNTDKPKILIVDDERFYINVLVELLSDDYHTIVTKNGEEALSRALDLPDLILLDVMMPGMSGYEVCRQLKSDERTRNIPVIFLTIKSELDAEVQGFELGAVDYIVKPISPAIVKARVATHITLNNVLRGLTKQNESLLLEQKKKDEQLRCSQKLEALGKLTGGIAHDFNNILGIVLGYSELLQSKLDEYPKLKKHASQIIIAGERGKKITQKLLSFSGRKQSHAEVVNVNNLLKEQLHMLEKTLTASIDFVLELETDVWNIFIDKSDLEDAVLNMSINAMHAMPGGGELIFRTSNKILTLKEADSLNISPGEYMVLSLIDNGCGMDKKTLDKVFDPFFTTKGSQGTGLGMSQVYGFVGRSSGAIDVFSEPEKGTQITIYFPRNISEKMTKTDKSLFSINYMGSETVLIVDDEEALRNLLGEILIEQGYHVVYAKNADNAFDILQYGQVDLMVSDVIMPGMNGYDLALKAQEEYPGIKIQIMSGFDDNKFKRPEYESLYKSALKKPVQAENFLSSIRKLLDN